MSSKAKKLLIVGIVLIILIVVAIIAIVALNKTPEGPITTPTDNPGESTKSLAERVTVKTYRQINPIKNKEIRTEMPEISGLGDKSFENYINQKMVKTVNDYISEMEVVVDEDTPAEALYKYVVTYEKYANDVYLSLVINNNYQTGGMRSNIWKDTYNILVGSINKEVYLKDIFKPDADYKTAILKEINAQADARNPKLELVGGNGLSSLPDTQKFFIRNGKLIIYFDAAAIAPYVSGELEFEMPFAYENGKFII